ncbi:hypothetical protein B857_03838 [Solibacillus isronensis B3W22]|uniref:Uncharacterized protein n=1 Tax=Solibacillus isronensis B3W22 TaxID=1224748 RepID=K1KXN1_9BACL|nr:hypothetical protein [Solibacillus isronensis]AMO85360.1 hypothetical protein SOLI23_07105 [Solibacillus silvestris]EKB43378.1 hypothetical protein B857_03838 [Solibacillus isronensis B3W22]
MKLILKIPMNPIANLKEELKKMTPLSIALGHDNDVFVLLREEQIPLIGGSFPATVTEKSYRYQVVHLKDGQKKVLDLPEETWNYHYIQPIDDGHILLVCARSYYHDAQNIEENARVYDENGCFIRSFCLGDGIEHVFVTKNQEIWTGYFDEGVFGNYGWKDPVGSSGLVGWDASGGKMDSLEEDTEYYIFDCLALNDVPNEGIWFFFSLESMIGVRKEGLTKYYPTEDMHFHAFAVKWETIIAYQGRGEHAFFELQREGNEYKTVRKLELMKPNGKPLEPQLVNNRENKLLFLDGNELYMYELKSDV